MMRTAKKWTGIMCAAALTAGMAFSALAETGSQTLGPVCMDGRVTELEDGRFTMERRNGGQTDEVVILLGDDTKILEAVNGYPVTAENLEEGEAVRVYAGPAMTMSIPPMTTAEIVLTDVPADFGFPSYETVAEMTDNGDGTHTVTTASGTAYQVNQETVLLPYLTRNMVYVTDLTEGTDFLVWTAQGDTETASKIVIFQSQGSGNNTEETSAEKQGWIMEDGRWYFYEQNQVKKGWLLDGEDWYYLNPENGQMQTGFVTLDGKTYFLQEDGRMLTEARVFTPDENGALH